VIGGVIIGDLLLLGGSKRRKSSDLVCYYSYFTAF